MKAGAQPLLRAKQYECTSEAPEDLAEPLRCIPAVLQATLKWQEEYKTAIWSHIYQATASSLP